MLLNGEYWSIVDGNLVAAAATRTTIRIGITQSNFVSRNVFIVRCPARMTLTQVKTEAEFCHPAPRVTRRYSLSLSESSAGASVDSSAVSAGAVSAAFDGSVVEGCEASDLAVTGF